MAPKKAAASKKKADSKTASNAAPRDAKKKGKVVVTSQEETIGSAPSDSKAQEQAEALKKVASTKRFERRASFLRQYVRRVAVSEYRDRWAAGPRRRI
eukprot:scaffold1483_cov379-Prasinococcus_capsulatus_cf.AAC.5